MLAARDQENLVHGHQALAASKPLNQSTRAAPPKTPANRYPKTPLKIPLQDENAPTGFGKKSVLQTKGKGIETLLTDGKSGSTFDKNAFITPMGPRTRAPLGMKTTNAKAKAFQTPAGPESGKAQLKPTSTRPLRQKISHAETIKLEIHGDEPDPLVEREVEYCPPKPQERPYESEDFPDGCLDYSIVKGASQRKDFYQRYYNPVDANGLSRKDKQFEEELARSMRATDAKILKAVEDDPCIVRDVPETYPTTLKRKPTADRRPASALQPKRPSAPSTRGPATITSRRVASALALAPRPTTRAPARTPSQLPLTRKPAPFLRSRKAAAPAVPAPSTMRVASAAAASRSTIGYTRGRSASSVLNTGTFAAPKQQQLKQQSPPPPLQRAASNHSTASDATITPARFFQKQGEEVQKQEEGLGKLALVDAFDVDDDEMILALGGGLPECLKKEDEEDEEEFEML